MQVHRHGFRQYLSGIAAEGDDGPRECDKESSLLKSATVAVDIDGMLDVVELNEEVRILEEGQPISLDLVCEPIVMPLSSEGGARQQRRQMQRALNCTKACM